MNGQCYKITFEIMENLKYGIAHIKGILNIITDDINLINTERDIRLVHGTGKNNKNEDIQHAWIEFFGKIVYDPTSQSEEKLSCICDYYKNYNITNARKFSETQCRKLSIHFDKIGTQWNLISEESIKAILESSNGVIGQ
jgi:hypothetical protein